VRLEGAAAGRPRTLGDLRAAGIAVRPVREEMRQNLLAMLALATGQDAASVAQNYDGKGMKDLKEDVSEALVGFLVPLQTKIRNLVDDRAYLASVVAEGNARAQVITSEKVRQAKEAMGLMLGK